MIEYDGEPRRGLPIQDLVVAIWRLKRERRLRKQQLFLFKRLSAPEHRNGALPSEMMSMFLRSNKRVSSTFGIRYPVTN